ncbi:MAG: 16S rRNA (adenine(1518)-N(6)/adenine(1519)-N(6))-dimethyltransferase RsmA [Chloroflexi bacterium]|nr:16S rRNA (adenine(1518)-N(6)/adenine(1519)-N(6))-dimethyltransferase RsmA [Chloroflexota bacterium]
MAERRAQGSRRPGGSGPNPPSPARQLRQQGRRAKKSLGQHFLRDRAVLLTSVEAAELTPQSIVIEVGPGLGALTAELAKAAGKVVAIELDDGLAASLQGHFAGSKRVRVIAGNVLAITPEALLRQGLDLAPDAPLPAYSVVANLPYNIGNAVLRRFLGATHRPERMVVMVQREVARSICAAPGDMTPLGVSVQLFGRPRIVAMVPPSAFYPPPKVESAIVRIDVTPAPGYTVVIPDEPTFFRVARAAFVGRRKQLRNSLHGNLVLPDETVRALLAEAGVTPDRRPQTLTLSEWGALARAYAPLWVRPSEAETDAADEDLADLDDELDALD